ncbi:hypothetical protein FQA39_LY16645 [Lamprigera yunnana]|nr:hypothetical protein FQA39_LY16645 [Lamprigera yunnana]
MINFRILFWLNGACTLGLYHGDLGALEEKWFEQYLDHFDPFNNSTFLMRYYEFDEFFQNDGPLLLEIGGEVTIEPSTIRYSPVYFLAKKLSALIVLLEHRYYGKSSPFENATQNYDYLSTEQALEDVAYFIKTYKNATPGLQSSKVAVFGCSYAGNLATWMRLKYSHLVNAAWASSAPLRIVLDFYQYYEVAGEIYSNVSSECIAIIRQGYREIKSMLLSPEDERTVRETFEDWECGNVTEMSNYDILATVRTVLSDQYNKPKHGVESCKFLQSKNSTTTCFRQLSAFVLSIAGEVCFDDDESNVLAWSYQTCTQFGYSFTTTSHNQPFRDTYSVSEADSKFCSNTFGAEFNLKNLERSIARMNRVYGGTSLNITKVVTIQGKQDPWNKLGLQTSPNEEAPVFLIPGFCS